MDLQGNNTCDDSVSAVYVTAIFITLSVTGILSAVVGNTLVCVAVFKTRALRTSANYLLVSLSMASLLFVPVLITYAISLTMRECDPIMKKLCPWSSKMDFVLFFVVMLHLLFISLDRLVAIKMPLRCVLKPEIYYVNVFQMLKLTTSLGNEMVLGSIGDWKGNFTVNTSCSLEKEKTITRLTLFAFLNRYPSIVTTKRTLILIIVLWSAGVLEGVFPIVFHGIQHEEGKALLQLMYGCLQNNKIPEESEVQPIVPHFLVLMSLSVFLPSGIMLISHAWIFLISFKQYKRIRMLEDAVSQRRVTEMRAAKTVAIAVFSALACFAPLLAVTFITTFEPPSGRTLNPSQYNVKYILFPSLKILYLLAITLNPLLYALKCQNFKVAFKRMLPKCLLKGPDTQRYITRSVSTGLCNPPQHFELNIAEATN